MTLAPQRSSDAQRGGALLLQVADPFIALPVAPEEGVEVELAEALDRLRHLALEREPTYLAVGENLQPRLLLRGDSPVDCGVLDALELRRPDPSRVEVFAGGQQFRRSDHAADYVGVGQAGKVS